MGPRRPTYVLVAAMLLSLLLHGTLLIPALYVIMTGRTELQLLQARFDPEDFHRPPEEQEDQEQLGIDEGTPSTMTWIGYEDYQEHLAQLAEVEQAAFKDSRAGSQAPPAEAANQAPAAPQAAQEARESASAEDADALAEIEQWIEAHTPGQGPRQPTTPSDDVPRNQALEEALDKLDEMLDTPAAAPQPQDRQDPTESPTQPGQPQAQPTEEQSPGDAAQKEADATSTIEVPLDQLRPGRPLAAQGLEIRTRKPVFTSLVLLTAAPANPRVEIRFGRNGVATKPRFLQRSGDPRIDEAILSSLYRWRARGKRLAELKGDETVAIRIRIMINARR